MIVTETKMLVLLLLLLFLLPHRSRRYHVATRLRHNLEFLNEYETCKIHRVRRALNATHKAVTAQGDANRRTG